MPAAKPKLTVAQASEMQDMLIAEYSKEEFQKELHARWFIADDPMKRMQFRQELCLKVQGPIISKFGYEASRKGVALSVQAFNDPAILGDAEVQKKNLLLGHLVNPDLQEGRTDPQPVWYGQGQGPRPAEEQKPARAPQGRPEAKAPKEPVHQPAQPPQPPRQPVQQLQAAVPLEEAFLRRFSLGPPGGFLHEKTAAQSAGPGTLTRESAKSMLDELIAGFVKEDFQRRLREAIQSAGGNQAKVRAARQKVSLEVQIPVVHKYGFEASFNGVLMSTQAFTQELNADPEIAQKNALVFWLIDPAAQAWTPVPVGPARIVLYTTVRVQRRPQPCSITTDLAGNVRSLKENVQLKTGVLWQAQRLFLGDKELDDWDLLHTFTHVGGTVELRLEQRREEIVTWLVQVAERAEVLAEAPRHLVLDGEFIWPAIQQQVKVLSYAPPEVQANRDLILRVVNHCGQALQYAHPHLRADREVVLAAVRQDGWALQHAAPGLQADREVVLNAVWQDGWALQFAAVQLRGERDIVMVAASKDAWVVGSVAPELQNDREVIMTAVRQDWRVLETVVSQFRGDREVILTAVSQDGWALEFASEELCADREVVLMAARKAGEALRFANKKLLSDREIAFAAVKNCGVALSLVDAEIQDLEMVILAVKGDPRALPFVHPRLHEDVKKTLGFNHVPSWGTKPGAGMPGGGPGAESAKRWVMPDLKKHFDVLGLKESASPQEIKKQYRQLALVNHPDKHPEDPEKAKKIFQKINNAYQAIKEAVKL